MDFLLSIYNNKLLFYGIIVVIGFIIFSIFLVKRIDKEKIEEDDIDYERIDGDDSLFDEVTASESEIKDDNGKLDLEVMIEKMQKDLDAKASEVVEKFENEQEEKSVISYQELLNEKNKPAEVKENNHHENISTNKINNTTENDLAYEEVEESKMENNYNNLQYANDKLDRILDVTSPYEDMVLEKQVTNDFYEENNSENTLKNRSLYEENIAEEPNMYTDDTAIEPNLYEKDDFVNAIKTGDYEEGKRFKSTDFVSPIYGKQDINIKYPTVQNMKEFRSSARNYNKFELEQTLNMEPLNDEIRRNEDFLEALKEFRKNLE